ncbi:unnamed protein product [Dovyalis caffra]|uniref:Uncharacterized protein n=1 Tax=Dovyalis caffra TaxID=77055 RepID=A0AAV1RV38_9ROSI|nr:unnamed protein product [Dovyalis caffra]
MDFSPSDSHNVLENRRMAYWGQGMSNYTDAFAMNQGLVPGVPSTQVHPAVPFHNYNLTNLGQEAETNNQLLGNMQVVSYDEKYHMARVDSLNQLVSFNEEVNPERNNASQEIFYGQDSSAGENANVIGEQFYQQQPVNSMPQIHPANPLMPQQWNILPYDPVNNPNPTVDEFGNVVNFNNNWS